MNTDISKQCFTCGQDCGDGAVELAAKSGDFGIKAGSDWVCAACNGYLRDAIALVSITDLSFHLQAEALKCYYDRLMSGQRTPYPQLLVRTGLTLFVKECYVIDTVSRGAFHISEAHEAAFKQAVASVLTRRWMTVPDSVYEEDGLTKSICPEVLADWRSRREYFTQKGY